MKNDYEFCILKSEEELIEYEKGLFVAFNKMTDSPYRKENYKIIDGCRYQNNILYSDQKIYGIKKDNKLIIALSIRINIKDQMIVEKIGFKINPEDKKKKICEGIDYFNLIPFNYELFEIYLKFFNFVLPDLKNNGFEIIYGSCEEKLKRLYEKMGYIFIDKIKLNGTYELLTRLPLV